MYTYYMILLLPNDSHGVMGQLWICLYNKLVCHLSNQFIKNGDPDSDVPPVLLAITSSYSNESVINYYFFNCIVIQRWYRLDLSEFDLLLLLLFTIRTNRISLVI